MFRRRKGFKGKRRRYGQRRRRIGISQRFRRRVKGIVNRMAETKYVYSSDTGSADASVFYCFAIRPTIAQGAGQNQRIGNTIRTTSFSFRWRTELTQNPGEVITQVRWIIGMFKKQPANWPTTVVADDILDGPSMFTQVDKDLFKAYYDKTTTMATTGSYSKFGAPTARFAKFYMKLRREIDFKANLDSTYTEFNKIPVIACFTNVSVANTIACSKSIAVKMNFKDM